VPDVTPPWAEADLRLAAEHVARAEIIVARQEEIIEELERDGHDAKAARTLLEQFRSTLDVFKKHKRYIEERLKER